MDKYFIRMNEYRPKPLNREKTDIEKVEIY